MIENMVLDSQEQIKAMKGKIGADTISKTFGMDEDDFLAQINQHTGKQDATN